MNYSLLLDLAADLGYELAMCGAETFRVEESISLVLKSYGVESEVFAIPNCLHVSIEADGHPMTRMRRIGHHGNDLDALEQLSGLSRAICNRKPTPAEGLAWLQQVRTQRRSYAIPVHLLGNFLGAAGFGILYGGTIPDGICAGICGLVIGIINLYMEKMMANQFFRIIAASFPMTLVAYAMCHFGLAQNPDIVTIGALMILVPGLLFTNAMRDVIFGDTNSGINRVVQVLLIAIAIALGTAAAWNVATLLWGAPFSVGGTSYTLLQQLLPCFVGCIGFSILFNIHGQGMFLCALGGILTWFVYSMSLTFGTSSLMAFFGGTIAAAVYAEIMARVRKCPAITYLVVAIFPLIPGAGVYYTMNYAVLGNMDQFAAKGMQTAAEAGIMAVSILLVSTVVRMYTMRKAQKR